MATPVPRRILWQRVETSSLIAHHRCAYCGVRLSTVLCGAEHAAYMGQWLCDRCYLHLFEGPVLFSHAAVPEEGQEPPHG